MGSPRWRRLAPPGSPWPARGCPTKGQPVWGLCSASPWRWWPCTFRALHQRDVSAPRCTCGAPLDERGRVAARRRASPGACELPTASISWLSSPSAAASARSASGRAPTNRTRRPATRVKTGAGSVSSNLEAERLGTARPARSRAPSTSRRWKGCWRTKQDSRSQCLNQISLLQSNR